MSLIFDHDSEIIGDDEITVTLAFCIIVLRTSIENLENEIAPVSTKWRVHRFDI